jgi:hypothetical protein
VTEIFQPHLAMRRAVDVQERFSVVLAEETMPFEALRSPQCWSYFRAVGTVIADWFRMDRGDVKIRFDQQLDHNPEVDYSSTDVSTI